MQEKRESVNGWANKSNFELQKLCDPLWHELSEEDKRAYKDVKKSLPRSLVTSVGLCPLNSGRHVSVIVGLVETVDKVWVTPRQPVEDITRKLKELNVKENCEEVSRKNFSSKAVYAGKFSGDDKYYRCQIVGGFFSDTIVRLIDFGITESVTNLYILPEIFSFPAPLAVQVYLDGMQAVTDTDKNRRKVEKKLRSKRITVIVNDKGIATFFKGDKEVSFTKEESKSKKIVSQPTKLLDVPEAPEEEFFASFHPIV